MADSHHIDIVQAIETALAGGSFSQTIVVTRAYFPTIEIEDNNSIQVRVMPGDVRARLETEEIEPESRETSRHQYTTSVTVQKKINQKVALATELDPLALLVQELADFVGHGGDGNPALNPAGAAYIRTIIDPNPSYAHLEERATFMAALIFQHQNSR